MYCYTYFFKAHYSFVSQQDLQVQQWKKKKKLLLTTAGISLSIDTWKWIKETRTYFTYWVWFYQMCHNPNPNRGGCDAATVL